LKGTCSSFNDGVSSAAESKDLWRSTGVSVLMQLRDRDSGGRKETPPLVGPQSCTTTKRDGLKSGGKKAGHDFKPWSDLRATDNTYHQQKHAVVMLSEKEEERSDERG
jgi:hypothetical protein